MSGICSHCSGCTEFYGRVNLVVGLVYDCADECPYYQAERKAMIEARNTKKREEEAKMKAEAEAKKKAELEKLYKFFEANAKEPAWFKKEHPAHYAAGWRLLECGNLYGLKCGKETTIGKGFIPPLPAL